MTSTRHDATALRVLAVCFVMNLFARGTSETYAVFLIPLGDEFEWSRSELTSVYSVYMVVHGLSAPIVGYALDRLGPRFSYVLGVGCLGGGLSAAAHLDALWQFYLCIGVLGGVGVAAMSMVPGQAMVSRWFRARVATAMGVVYAGLGSGVIIVVPLTQILIERIGWRDTYGVLGAVLLLVLLPVAVLPWRRWAAGHPGFAVPPASAGAGGAPAGWTLGRAMRERAFWGLFSIFFFTAVTIYAAAIQIVVYLVSIGFDAVTAATAFGCLGLLSTTGMVLAGTLSDRIGRRPTATLSFGLTLIGLVLLGLLAKVPSPWLLGAFVLAFGISMGSRGPLVSALAAELYAGRGLGAIYGAITLGMGIGAALGSWISGALYDLTGGYAAVFAFAAFTAVLGLSQFWLVPALARGPERGS